MTTIASPDTSPPSAPKPQPVPTPRPPLDAAARAEQGRVQNDELAAEVTQRLEHLAERPVVDHPEEYGELHALLSERLRETER